MSITDLTRTLPAALVCLFAASLARAGEDDPHRFSGQVDLRWVASDAPLSFANGGFGLTRFDDSHEGPQLGRAFLEYRGRLLDTLDARVLLDAYGDADKNPVDISEAYLEWRPYPRNAWRWRVQAGAFYPPVSLENRGPGWQSLYSLSPSAINTWIGEEFRTIGAEVNATWMGTRSGAPFDVSLIGAVYAWNDPAGVLIFQRGWAVHDRQTALFGGLPQPFYPNGTTRHQLEFFHEIDNKPGYYAGLQLVHPAAGVTVRALHYDNRGDPAVSNAHETTWLTRFDSVGLKAELPRDWTFVAQWLAGDTAVGGSPDGRGFLIGEYDAWFALVSRSIGKHRFTARYDDFYTETTRGAQFFDGWQEGNARLLAYTYSYDRHWQGVVEASRLDARVRQRALLGLPPREIEKTLQLALRYSF